MSWTFSTFRWARRPRSPPTPSATAPLKRRHQHLLRRHHHLPVTIRIDDTGSLMPGMNATAALDIPPCRRYVIVKATAGFAVFRLILKSLLFYSCLDFTQNLGKTHFCLTFGVHFSIRSLFFGIFFNVFAIGIYSFDSCFLSTAWIS